MKFKAFEDLMLGKSDGSESSEAKAEPEAKKVAHTGAVETVDRRHVIQESLSPEDLRYMFQGMSHEQFADLVFDAMIQDPKMTARIVEKTNGHLHFDAVLRESQKLQKLREYFGQCSNEELVQLAIDEMVFTPAITEEINEALNKKDKNIRQEEKAT